jgi:hypothetical protein
MTLHKISIKHKKFLCRIGFFLVFIHLCIALSHTYFLHIHTLEDGRKIAHSHPFKSNDSQHQHSNTDYQILHNLQHIVDHNAVATLIVPDNFVQFFDRKHLRLNHKSLSFSFYRGPPSFY